MAIKHVKLPLITHFNPKADLEKAKRIGEFNYNNEQIKKIKLLDTLLDKYNDGRQFSNELKLPTPIKCIEPENSIF